MRFRLSAHGPQKFRGVRSSRGKKPPALRDCATVRLSGSGSTGTRDHCLPRRGRRTRAFIFPCLQRKPVHVSSVYHSTTKYHARQLSQHTEYDNDTQTCRSAQVRWIPDRLLLLFRQAGKTPVVKENSLSRRHLRNDNKGSVSRGAGDAEIFDEHLRN